LARERCRRSSATAFFLAFPAVDRTSCYAQGAGLNSLTGVGEPLVGSAAHLTKTCENSGDDITRSSATLYDGPVRDFNLMVRRTHARGEVAIVRGSAEAIAPARFQLCYAAVGVCECLIAGHVPLTLHDGHALLIDTSEAAPSVLHVNPLSSDAVALGAAIDLIEGAH
jgi:environmental stress-induced protein Ves